MEADVVSLAARQHETGRWGLEAGDCGTEEVTEGTVGKVRRAEAAQLGTVVVVGNQVGGVAKVESKVTPSSSPSQQKESPLA